MDAGPDPPAPASGQRPVPVDPQQVRALAALACQESQELRRQLAALADAIAVSLEEHAAVHEGMASQNGPAGAAGGHAERARRLAAAEREVARAYRDGQPSPRAARGTIRG